MYQGLESRSTSPLDWVTRSIDLGREDNVKFSSTWNINWQEGEEREKSSNQLDAGWDASQASHQTDPEILFRIILRTWGWEGIIRKYFSAE